MDNISTNIELLYEKAKSYAETNVELAKLNAIDKTADIVSALAGKIISVMLLMLFTLFINIAISIYLGQVLGSLYLGFLVVSVFYLIGYFVFNKWQYKIIKEPITNLVIAKLLKSKIVTKD